MKGVILAGGLGTRLYPLTKITNKHLLPIFDRPMIYYPIEALVNAGITDIMIVTGGKKSGDFLSLLGNGSDFGLKHLNYTYQKGEGGIAEALGLCEHWAAGEEICVILGDNIIELNIARAARNFREQAGGAKIMLKEVDDPERFGVADLKGDKVVGIEEKPKKPVSNLAVIGIYMYDARVFQIIKTLEPSDRGEYEITDVNQVYLERGELVMEALGRGMAWLDTGTHDSLQEASEFIETIEKRQGLMISCPEEIAYRLGLIDGEQLESLATPLGASEYGRYLLQLLGDADATWTRTGA